MDEKGKGRSVLVHFLIVDIDLPYKVINGSPTSNKVKAEISTYQLLLKFEAGDGKVAQLFANQKLTWEFYVNNLKNQIQDMSRKRKQPKHK